MPLVLFGNVRLDAHPIGVECAIASGMSARRRAEFFSARALAHEALTILGSSAPNGIGQSECGTPIWPSGVAASIAHSGHVVAVAASKRHNVSIGIDVEPFDAVPPEVLTAVTAPGELLDARSKSHLQPDSPLLGTLLYVAKESAFKAISVPCALRVWRPRELRVRLNQGNDRRGGFTVDGHPALRGLWWRRGGMLCAIATVGVAG